MYRSSISGDSSINPHNLDIRIGLSSSRDEDSSIDFAPKQFRGAVLRATNITDLNDLIRLIESSNLEQIGDNNGEKEYEFILDDEIHYRFIINETEHFLSMIEENLSSSSRSSTTTNLNVSNSEFRVESYHTNTEGQLSSYEIRNPQGRRNDYYENEELHLQRIYDTSGNIQNILLYIDGEDDTPVGNYQYELENNNSVNNPEEYIQYLAQRLNSFDKLADFISNFMEYTFDEKDYWQTSTETVERIGFAKMLGDCDDWAILVRDILRLQGVNAHTVLVPGHATCFWLEQDEDGNYNAYTLGTMGFKRNGESVDFNKTGSSESTYSDPMEATNSALGFFAGSPDGGPLFRDEISAGRYEVGIEGDMERLAVPLDVFTEPIYFEYFMAQYDEDIGQQRQILEEIIETNPSTRYLRDLAVVYLRLDDQGAFYSFFEQYKENEDNPEQLTNFVLNLMKNGYKEFGLVLIANLINEDQAQPLLYLTYAVHCEEDSQARETLDIAAQRYPDNQLISFANLQQDRLLSEIRRDPGKLPIVLESNGLLTSEQYLLLKFNRGPKEIDIPN